MNNENDQIKLIEPNIKQSSTENKEFQHQLSSDEYFKISVTQIDRIFESYMKGHREIEMEELKTHGGSEGLLQKVKSNSDTGLTGKDEKKFIKPHDDLQRMTEFSDNIKIEAPLKSCCRHAIEALQDLMLQLLIVAAIIQIILGSIPQISEDPSKEWVEGFSIVIAVTVVVSVGSITNWSKEKAFKQLNKKSQDELEVSLIRNSESRQFHPDNILVGDILKFQNGKTIPVDGIILSSNNVEMDESPLTGESNRMKKIVFSECQKELELIEVKGEKIEKLSSCLIFSGTKCVNGTGIMLVLRVGKHSEIGKIQGRIAGEDSTNSLEDKLNSLAGDIGRLGMAAALITLIALMIRFGVGYASSSIKYKDYLRQKNETVLNYNVTSDPYAPEDPSITVGHKILKIILLCVAIIVVAIPEGLPLAVTLSLSFAISKMQKHQNLVRAMTSCETMGSANYVCTDKTGTLTMNVMKIQMFYNLDDSIKVENDSEKKINLIKNKNESEYQKLIEQTVSINIDINFEMKDGKKEITKDCNATDKAFYDFLQENLKLNFFTNYEKYFSNKNNVKLIPFTSENKCMTSLVKNPEFNINGFRVFIKGGPDVILPKSKYYFNKETNKPEPLTEEKINEINTRIYDYAGESLRTIGIAYKDIDETMAENYDKLDQNGNLIINKDEFILLAIVGIKDPLKEGVLNAVTNCKKSGITVIMVTGDNIITARAIANECGIIDTNQSEILKKEYEKEELKKKTKSTENIEKSNISMLGPEFSSMVGLICDNEGCKKPTQNLNNDIHLNNLELDLCKCFMSEFEKEKMIEKHPEKKEYKDRKVRKEIIANLSQFQKIITNLKVIARAQPVDKYVLVLGLKSLGNIVAVTGDGTNDAQALSKADVGFAMGKAGTDIAKDASDIILLDDNFASIITAVLYGRNIFDCIRKFIQFQLTVNLCACLLVFITACIGNETPLTAIQMLWVNLIMDSLGSLALATEPPNEKKLLARKPYGRNEYIVNKLMWKHIIAQAFVQLGVMLFLYLYAPQFIRESEPFRIAEADIINLCFGKYPGRAPDEYGYFILDGSEVSWETSVFIKEGLGTNFCGTYGSKTNLNAVLQTYQTSNGSSAHMTIIFNTFVIYTLINQLNARIIDDSFNTFLDIEKNFYFIFIEIIEFGLHAVLIQVSANIFKVTRMGLTAKQWGICIGFGFISMVVNFLAKLIFRVQKNKVENYTVNVDVGEDDKKLLVVNKGNDLQTSKEKSLFNPMVIRSSGSRQADVRQYFAKN